MLSYEKKEQLAYEYYEEGRAVFFENRLSQAVLLVQNALHLFKEVGNLKQYTASLNMMGVIYAAIGNEGTAMDCYLEGLQIATENRYATILPLFYNNIGSRYQDLKEHEKAITYFKKAVKALDDEECKTEEHYGVWCVVTYLNLAKSYGKLGNYGFAWNNVNLSENFLQGDALVTHEYTFLIFKCLLCWDMKQEQFVYDNVDKLMNSVKNMNASDYIQNMTDLCELLEKMGEYDKWKSILLCVTEYAKQQDSVYFELIRTEMWMKYYQSIHDTKKYVELCVEHAELYMKQKEVTYKERVTAIDIKIELSAKEIERKNAELLSSIDPLTGLGNRYLLEKNIEVVLKQAKDKQEYITVGVLDIDCFKQHNDTYGHIQGDKCLKAVASVIENVIKGMGKAYRFGGDEFVLILKNRTRIQVTEIAELIKTKIDECKMENINSTAGNKITISQGYAFFSVDGSENIDKLIEYADKALYQVKEHGRNGYYIVDV